jgi:hypothetical protein
VSPPEPRGFAAFLLGTDPRARETTSPAAIIRFAAIAVFVYMLLIIFQPMAHRAYGYFYRAFATAAFSRVGGAGSVHFLDLRSPTLFNDLDAVTPGDLPKRLELPKPDREKDTLLVLQNRNQPGKFGLFRSGSRLMAYIPTALFLSLFVATPLPWLKRLVALIAGFALLHLFIVFRLWVYVLNVGFADVDKKYHLYEPGKFWRDLLRRGDRVLADDPTFNYVAPVVVWLLAILAVEFVSRYRARLAEDPGRSRRRRR